MIKAKVALLEGRLFSSQSGLFENRLKTEKRPKNSKKNNEK